MKFKDVMQSLFTAIGDFIKVVTAWIGIVLDWTDEVKEMSDQALDEMQKEREVDTRITMKRLEEELNKKLASAGLDPLPKETSC